jgi:hypothetical protein
VLVQERRDGVEAGIRLLSMGQMAALRELDELRRGNGVVKRVSVGAGNVRILLTPND